MKISSHVRQLARRDNLLPLCAIFLVYLLSSSWRFPVGGDGRAMLATSRSLLTQGTLAVDGRFASDEGFGPSARVGVDGRAYVKYGLGLPVIELPFVAVALLISRFAAVTEGHALAGVLSLLNPLLTTCTAIAIFSLCRSFDFERGVAWLVVTIYSVGTCAWAYAGVDGSEPLQGLCLISAFIFLVKYRSTRKSACLAASGCALAYAVFTKPANAVLLPAFWLYAVAVWCSARLSLRETSAAVLRLAAPIATCLVILASLNWYRWGSVFETGYEPHAFANQLMSGMHGLMFSFNKGIVFYAPVVLLAPVGIGLMGKTRRAEAAFIALAFLAYVALYAKFYNWGAGWSWGPRYLMPILPLLMAPVAQALTAARLWRYLAAGLFAAGLGVNGLGVLVDGDAYHSAIMNIDLTERTGFVPVGNIRNPGQMVVMAIPPDYVLPEFSEITGKLWLGRVAWDGCSCDQETSQCGCRTGALENNATFLSPPWIEHYPEAHPMPPYGTRLINPWIAHRLHQRLLR